MSKINLKTETSSVKDAMKEFYATEKLRRSASSSPNTSGKLKNANKHVSPSSVVTPNLKSTPRNDDDSFGSQISKFFGGSPTNIAADINSTASSSSSDVLTNTEDQTEIAYLKNEMNSLQDMLEDSMTTLMTLNDKLQAEKDVNVSLLRRAEEAESQVEELSAHNKRQDQQIAAMQREIERLTRAVDSDGLASRRTIIVSDDDEEESNKDDVKGNATRQMSRVARNDQRLAEVREDLNTNMRALSEQLCDGLVACDEEFDYLMERNPLFRGLAQPKPEPDSTAADSKMDKKMFSPRNTDQPEGFLFGVPSTRFKVCQHAIKESENGDDDEDEDTNECDEDYIDYGAEEYAPKACEDSLSMLEFGY